MRTLPKCVWCARATGIAGLPDSYGRGRFVGDYRRIAPHGIDALIEEKQHDLSALNGQMTEEKIRLREEVAHH